MATSSPVSSRVSRRAVSSRVSPASGVPFGSAHSSGRRRWTITTSGPPGPRGDGRRRRTTWRAHCAGPAPGRLGASGARDPVRERGTACRQPRGVPDGREPESARLRSQRADARRRDQGAARAMVDGRRRGQSEPGPVRAATPDAEIDGWVGDEAGHQTHAHARHCTPPPWWRKGSGRRQPTIERPRSRRRPRRATRHP